eukprot:8353864-Lingulodinium_polyedra.AAC.1
MKAVGLLHIMEQDVDAFRADAVNKRQAGRLQVACRSAASILLKQDASKIEAFRAELKTLKISMPKKIMERIAALEKKGDD